jgi:alginate O-acetyltransferase complex protein AlgI
VPRAPSLTAALTQKNGLGGLVPSVAVLFTSAAYLLLFLPATVAACWIVPARLRVVLLLVASYVFYLSWNPRYGLLLAASTVVNFAIARRLPSARSPRGLLAAGVAFNLAVLAYFKYVGLFSASAADLIDWLGLGHTGSFDGLHVLLPLAISFFTFEMISVLVDVYRGDVRVGGFLPFAAYKAFFPKLVSGPITRYRELAPQLERPQPLEFERFQSGLALFALGLAKKLVLADNVAVLANSLFNDPAAASSGTAAVGILAFGVQIYLDFSAYTDMARGAARMLGLELPRNFNFPYAATSPSDFWRRWHMSLSRWLRDYLYIPLGGNRHGRLNTYRNLMITMVLGGLWHGAAWHFALWGGLQGAFLSVDHALRGRFPTPGWALRAIARGATLTAVFGAWVFFRAGSLDQAFEVFAALGRLPVDLSAPTALYSSAPVWLVLTALLAFVLGSAPAAAAAARIRDVVLVRPSVRLAALASLTLCCWTLTDVLTRSTSVPFIYFRF